ncbi:LysR family transcriptional regulator [Caldimonas tepidiphila]|uniref:LysR family transcriptional regulator n=1 Tax=Caldimonas tepidiphila TaxID=2315841 RepID=UPI0014755CAE|nr:LysR family transcriptional regulator [Caldimonas tepidiphila]
MPPRSSAPAAPSARPGLNWDDLRYALAIADAGSLAGAARALEVQHSTVLRRLGALERRLGARLFERQRSGYLPTEAGELLVAQARQMQPGIDELARRLRGRDLALAGSVRLNTSYIAMLYLLPAPLAAFSRAHPGIEVEVVEASGLADLSRRDADLALRLSRAVPEHLVGRRLGDVRFRIYACRGASGLPQSPRPLAQLLEFPWIGYERDRSTTFFERWMRAQVPDERIRLRVDLFHSMVAMLRTGLGIGLLPSFVEADEPDLVAVSAPIEEIDTPLWLLTHPDLRSTARIRLFMQQVGDALAQRLRAGA